MSEKKDRLSDEELEHWRWVYKNQSVVVRAFEELRERREQDYDGLLEVATKMLKALIKVYDNTNGQGGAEQLRACKNAALIGIPLTEQQERYWPALTIKPEERLCKNCGKAEADPAHKIRHQCEPEPATERGEGG